jgi:hypothetical protein
LLCCCVAVSVHFTVAVRLRTTVTLTALQITFKLVERPTFLSESAERVRQHSGTALSNNTKTGKNCDASLFACLT